jgi:hypothetical protein
MLPTIRGPISNFVCRETKLNPVQENSPLLLFPSNNKWHHLTLIFNPTIFCRSSVILRLKIASVQNFFISQHSRYSRARSHIIVLCGSLKNSSYSMICWITYLYSLYTTEVELLVQRVGPGIPHWEKKMSRSWWNKIFIGSSVYRKYSQLKLITYTLVFPWWDDNFKKYRFKAMFQSIADHCEKIKCWSHFHRAADRRKPIWIE